MFTDKIKRLFSFILIILLICIILNKQILILYNIGLHKILFKINFDNSTRSLNVAEGKKYYYDTDYYNEVFYFWKDKNNIYAMSLQKGYRKLLWHTSFKTQNNFKENDDKLIGDNIIGLLSIPVFIISDDFLDFLNGGEDKRGNYEPESIYQITSFIHLKPETDNLKIHLPNDVIITTYFQSRDKDGLFLVIIITLDEMQRSGLYEAQNGFEVYPKMIEIESFIEYFVWN